MKKIVAGSTAVLLMLTASGALIGCKSTPDESTSSSDSSLESTSSVDSAEADAGFDIDGEERETDSSGEGEDAELSDGAAATGGSSETAREGAQSWITSDGTISSNHADHADEKKEGGFGNSYGLASGEGVDGEGVAVMKGGEAGEVDTSAPSSAPNDEENFPSTMERLKNAGKGSASSDGSQADGDGTDASAGAGTETASANTGGSRQSAVAPNANDSSTAGLGDRSKNSSGSGTGNGAGTGSASGGSGATNDSVSGAAQSGGNAKNGTAKNNGSGISGTSSIDGSRNANPATAKPSTTPQAESRAGNKNDKSSASGNGGKSANGSGTAAQNGKNGSGTASANSGTNKNGSGTNANGNGNSGGKSANGSGTNANGSGNGGKAANDSAGGVAQGNGGKAANGTGGSGDAKAGSGNGGKAGSGAAGDAAAKDRQGMTGDDTTDYVEKFSKWFHPALADVQRCGYFYTTPEICQFDMIQGDFRKVSGYKKAAYGFVFGYSQPDPRGYLSDYIRFEINVDGEYALYTWDGQNYVDLVEPNDRGTAYFYEHPAIYKGYNTLNQIKIEDTGSSYNVYVNGTLIQGNIPYLNSRATKGVMAFFSVAKEHQEDLPKTPVNVGMRITDVKRH